MAVWPGRYIIMGEKSAVASSQVEHGGMAGEVEKSAVASSQVEHGGMAGEVEKSAVASSQAEHGGMAGEVEKSAVASSQVEHGGLVPSPVMSRRGFQLTDLTLIVLQSQGSE